MKADKLAANLDKMIEKLETYNLQFSKPENQAEFDTMKSDALALLAEMSELVEAEDEEEESHDD